MCACETESSHAAGARVNGNPPRAKEIDAEGCATRRSSRALRPSRLRTDRPRPHVFVRPGIPLGAGRGRLEGDRRTDRVHGVAPRSRTPLDRARGKGPGPGGPRPILPPRPEPPELAGSRGGAPRAAGHPAPLRPAAPGAGPLGDACVLHLLGRLEHPEDRPLRGGRGAPLGNAHPRFRAERVPLRRGARAGAGANASGDGARFSGSLSLGDGAEDRRDGIPMGRSAPGSLRRSTRRTLRSAGRRAQDRGLHPALRARAPRSLSCRSLDPARHAGARLEAEGTG